MSDSRPAVIAVAWVSLALGIGAIGAILVLRPGDSRSSFPLFLIAFVFVVWAVFLFIALSRDPTRRARSGRPGGVATLHTLSFTVGEREKHSVVFAFDQMWGWLTITVDGALIVRKFITFSFKLRRVLEFQVGSTESHAIRIEKARPLFAAFVRPQPTRAFCDGVVVAEDDGIS